MGSPAVRLPVIDSGPDAPSAGPSSRGYHRLAEYLQCPRRYAYRHLLHLEPTHVSDPLALGSLVHIGLMHHYLGRIAYPGALDPILAMQRAPSRIAHQFARAKQLVDDYRTRYAREPLRILDVEREFRVTAGGFLHTQRADLVAELNGKVIILDHKCLSRVGDGMVQEWSSSGQFTGYEVIGRALLPKLYGLPWGGVYVNAIKTQPPFGAQDSFRRVPLRVPPERVRVFPRIVAEVNADIQRCEDEKRAAWDYRPNPEACIGRWGVCDYKPLCDRGRDAEVLYVKALDAASDIREGSGS